MFYPLIFIFLNNLIINCLPNFKSFHISSIINNHANNRKLTIYIFNFFIQNWRQHFYPEHALFWWIEHTYLHNNESVVGWTVSYYLQSFIRNYCYTLLVFMLMLPLVLLLPVLILHRKMQIAWALNSALCEITLSIAWLVCLIFFLEDAWLVCKT